MNVEERQDQLGVQWEEDESGEKPAPKAADTVEPRTDAAFPEDINALPAVEPSDNSLRHKPSKSALRSKQSFKRELTTKKSAIWDPPPLFQAYPQAIKHATLRAPCLSAEAILRLQSGKSPDSSPSFDSNIPNYKSAKTRKERRLKRHTAAEVLSKGEWTRKIFIMVTSGYLLQYAGDGDFDRLPEKLMPLTTESAAFASDAIPGQPYVLQVSQVSDDQGTLDKEASRSMLKKLGLRNEMRRSTSTFLLVLETAEEMSAWLVAVRREINAMGGKEYKEDQSTSSNTQEPPVSLQQKPSQRYLVRRDPDQFASRSKDSQPSMDRAENDHTGEATNSTAPTPHLSNRFSLATQSSTVSRSISDTTSSTNQACLDGLRESVRVSYASNDAKTTSTSRDSSLSRSPEKAQLEIPDLTREFLESRPMHSRKPRATHRSAHGHAKTTASLREPLRPGADGPPSQHSAYHAPKKGRTPSPKAPNFSVPTFSKRYSTTDCPSEMSCSVQETRPSLVTEAEATDTKSQDNNSRESRKLAEIELRAAGKIGMVESNGSVRPLQSSTFQELSTSSDNEKRFSHRLSSLQYSRGISQTQLAGSTPPPHPAPTSALPALPKNNRLYRASMSPPPTSALPPLPTAGKLAHRHSMLSPPPTAPLPPLPVNRPSSSPSDRKAPLRPLPTFHESQVLPQIPFADASAVASNQLSKKGTSEHQPLPGKPFEKPAEQEALQAKRSSPPHNPQARDNASMEQTPPKTPHPGFRPAFDAEGLTPPANDSPPKPTRAPPHPPVSPQQGSVREARRRSRIGREPPPVSPPVASPRSKISVSSRVESYFDNAAPHPFIPPIRVSEGKFRGSLDGPWNVSYEPPQRTFFDLSVR